MRLSDRQLLGLPVVTQAGQAVGSIIGFECDTDHHTIETYLVSTSPLVTRLFGLQRRTLAVARSQVIAITAESMVVYDALVSTPISAHDSFMLPQSEATPIATQASLE
jgi:sporulation protein YlmC with PRC-barrel domain